MLPWPSVDSTLQDTKPPHRTSREQTKVRRLERIRLKDRCRGQRRLEKNTCCHLGGSDEKIHTEEKFPMGRNSANFLSVTGAATRLNRDSQKVNQGHQGTEQSEGKD